MGGTVSDVQFALTETYACPADCRPQGGTAGQFGANGYEVPGNPSTIDVGKISEGDQFSVPYCETVDSNGQVTGLEPPVKITATATALGFYNNEVVQSPPKPLGVYPMP